MNRNRLWTLFVIGVLTAVSLLPAAEYSWQKPHAKVLPTGDLEWAPEPFVFEKGDSARYIDYEGGNDANDGRTPQTAWKRHPWDAKAEGRAAECRGIHTYIFKRGVVYRGALVARESGQPGNPVRLTSDPSWGEGEAVISGSETVSGWKQGADRADIPESAKVWFADLDFAPRSLWMVEKNGTITRIPLARTPNWTVSNPEEVTSEWWAWENPQWWNEENRTTTLNGIKMHLGIDKKRLTREPAYYQDAIVWTEWAVVMGTPFPTRVEAFDAEKKALVFQGRWMKDSGEIHAGNRYFLEDKPQYLDAPGEFWFDRKGEGGRLYLRLPEDRDPAQVTLEAARHINLIQDLASANSPLRLDTLKEEERARLDLTGLRHTVISGLTFRFNSPWWDLDFPPWMHKEVDGACIRLLGSSDDVRISHCRFEHVTKAVRIETLTPTTHIGRIAVTDCEILFTDSGALNIGRAKSADGTVEEVSILRNRLFMIGARPFRHSDGHAIVVTFPLTMEVAGNILNRCFGSGVFIFGGKSNDDVSDAPLSRQLIHHNRVEQTLLAANDWGGIETWRGGPHYVFNNISANPNGYWNWKAITGKAFNARLSYAFYLDSSSKNYFFNNIAWGANNEKDSPLCNAAALYEATPTVHNNIFNNTFYRFAKGSNWNPAGGFHQFLGNIWDSMSDIMFVHGPLKEDAGRESKKEFPHETVAYGRNVFHGVGERFGVCEVSGRIHKDADSFQRALAERKALDSSLGQTTDRPPLRDPANRDMRPAAGGAAIDAGVRCFVPWALYAVVGEWNFYPRGNDPAVIPDEHWYMAPYYLDRYEYHRMPRHPLQAVNVSAADYIEGPLEDWIKGALRLNGKNQYAMVSHTAMAEPITYQAPARKRSGGTPEKRVAAGPELKNLDIHSSSFVLEVVFRTDPGVADGILMRKMNEQAGYALTIEGGTARLAVRSGGRESAARGKTLLNDGAWHHVLAELDRRTGALALYVNGRKDAEAVAPAAGSLSNPSDFFLGGSPHGGHLAGAFDFARVGLGSLADARTTIEELYAWQFNGPRLRDFCGNPVFGARRDAGAVESVE